MSYKIETLKDKDGNSILPRTNADAVNVNGQRLSDVLEEELDYSNVQNLTTAYTNSNPFIVPKKGIILACSGISVASVYDVNLATNLLRVFTTDKYVSGTTQVFKGQRVAITELSSGGFVKFIPFK